MLNFVRVTRTPVLTSLCAALLIGCTNPHLLQVNFDQDPGILRGSWSGTVTEECNKPFELLEWNTSSNELLAVRPYYNFSSLQNGAKVSLWNTQNGNKKLEWEVPWPAEKHDEYNPKFKYATFQNRVAAYDARRVLLFDRSSGVALGSTNIPLERLSELNTFTLSQNLEHFGRLIADTGYSYNNPGAVRAQVFKVETGQQLLDFPLNAPYSGLALNADGSWMAVNLAKNGVTVYEVASRKQLYNLPSAYSSNLNFSPDSKYFTDNQQIWKLEDGKPLLPTRDGSTGFNLLTLSNSRAFGIDRSDYPAVALSTYKLSDGTLERTVPYASQTQNFAVNPDTGAFISLTDGGCSAQIMNPDGAPGQKLALEPLENLPLTLELNAVYGNKDQYTVTGSATFRNSSFTVQGKVDGNTDNQFTQARGRAPQLPKAELKLLKDGVVRHTFQLEGGRGGPSYFSSGYGSVVSAEDGDRRFSLTLTKP